MVPLLDYVRTIGGVSGPRNRILAVSLLLSMSGLHPAYADDKPDPKIAAQMSLTDAKELVQRSFRWNFGGASLTEGVIPGAMEFMPDRIGLIWYASPAQSIRVCGYETFDPAVEPESVATQGFHKGQTVFIVESAASNAASAQGCVSRLGIEVPNHDEALRVAAAFLRWKNSTLAERQELPALEQQQFATIAAAYRASNTGPGIPEGARRFRVMAETALAKKRISDAVDAYEDGLKLAPWWPEGHFNAALALGELHYYDDAIEHMKKYILLVPEASDARAAQDKIYAWESEQQGLPREPSVTTGEGKPLKHAKQQSSN
ncbi:MAG TPA: hypothetical protein VN685_07185 [Rhizomicrobium sp.]|nr:hypothetical protein [Rhizomicrobium sp.]